MYLPIVFVLLFYIVIKEKNKRYKWLFIVSFVLSCIFFIYMQCFGKITMFSLDDAILKISKTSLFSPSDEYLRAEYYMEVSGHLKMMDHRMPKILYRLIISLVIYIPVIYCIYYVYIKSFKRAEKKQKLVYLAILVNVLTFIPVFIFAVDYGRWISAMFISQLILILSLVYMKDELILEALEGLQEKLLAKKYYVMAIIALYAMLPRFTHYEVFPLVNNINRIIETISSYFNMLMN
jgi:drug/metabolite transporter (DMT)-like permease